MIAPLAHGALREQAEATVARVMICDDSVVIRSAITRMLETDPQVRVVARVTDGQAALAEVKRVPGSIDVVVLDIEMPVMDGITALPLLLKADPGLRVIMASTLTTRGADIALRALRLGAADYVPKPATAAIADDSFRTELLAKVKGLARLRRRPVASAPARAAQALRPLTAIRPAPRLLAIGSSTGGPQADASVLIAVRVRLQGAPSPLPSQSPSSPRRSQPHRSPPRRSPRPRM